MSIRTTTSRVKGFLVEETYLKGALDKLGVAFDVDHIGRYKDAGDVFTRSNMSNETKEVMNGVLDQIFNSFCSAVADGRHKSVEDIRNLIDEGPFLASAAQSAGLIDELGYESQMYRDLTARVKAGELAKLSYKTYAKSVEASGERIAILAGEGDIVRGSVIRTLWPDGGNRFGHLFEDHSASEERLEHQRGYFARRFARRRCRRLR